MSFKPLEINGRPAARVGLGTWVLGGAGDWGAATPEAEALNTVSAALDAGINLIDTAPAYGWGRAEELAGRALKGRRTAVLLATKCGLRLDGTWPVHDLRPAQIMAECEASLKRLQTDFIDLYQIHWPDPHVPLADSLSALLRLKEQGKICAFGVCNFPPELLAQAVQAGAVAAQGPYSLLNRTAENIAASCAQKAVSFWAYGALGGGILSGKYKQAPNFRRRDARRYFYPYYFGPGFESAQKVSARVKELALQKKVHPSAVALAWVLSCPGVSGVLAGARSAAQAVQNAQAAQIQLTPQEREFLQHG